MDTSKFSHINVLDYFESDKHFEIYKMETIVQETDLDVFGHLNNANYLRYFEKARWHFINKNGYGLDKIKQERKGPVLLEVDLKFKRELKARDEIIILSQTIKVEAKFLTLKQVMVKNDLKIASEAVFFIGFFDLETRKLIQPPGEWLHAVGIKN